MNYYNVKKLSPRRITKLTHHIAKVRKSDFNIYLESEEVHVSIAFPMFNNIVFPNINNSTLGERDFKTTISLSLSLSLCAILNNILLFIFCRVTGEFMDIN